MMYIFDSGNMILLSVCLDFQQIDLGSVEKSEGYNAVAESSADVHGGISAFVFACGIFWEKSLVGGDYAADERKSDLSTVGMTCYYQVGGGECVFFL